MVLPKMGASYVIKKFADEVMAEPKAIVESAIADVTDPTGSNRQPAASSQQSAASSQRPETDELDGQAVSDEHGEAIGTARRLRSVAFYLVSDSYGDLNQELQSCLADDESRRYFVHDDRGNLTGVIFAPHPERMPAKAQAFRADDI
jgi:hypothetical protein